jgi:tetratricopeptide (TPR) repeat protein
MKKPVLARLGLTVLSACLLSLPAWATCGGGGGGGGGGGDDNGPGKNQAYDVPWQELKPEDAAPKEGLLVYWFPASDAEYKQSSLRYSRALALYAAHCVNLDVIKDSNSPLAQKYAGGSKLPFVVLVDANGTLIGKAESQLDMIKVEQVEQLVGNEIQKREADLRAQLSAARDKAKAGDTKVAVDQLKTVFAEKCMFPKLGREAERELKKLGVSDLAEVPPPPKMDPQSNIRMEKLMKDGLACEEQEKYKEAERLYQEAHELDPADATPLRYLGEVYRHHIGDWEKARQTFNEILAMQADPLARAVALHGLGKMTIHEGQFKRGEGLMEESVHVYPLAMTYRNLAVYWNSEGDRDKCDHYTKLACSMAPKDPYNLIFAAVFMAGNGHSDEALKIARDNEALLSASYNLAAIYAQSGQKEKALALLKRHFFQYERTESVRSKEMMEARVDAVFDSMMHDPAFLALTSGADNRLPMRGTKDSKPMQQ